MTLLTKFASFQIGFPGGTIVKNPPTNAEIWVWSVSQEDPVEKAVATHSCILAWKVPWTKELDGLSWVAKSWTSVNNWAWLSVKKCEQFGHSSVKLHLSERWDFVEPWHLILIFPNDLFPAKGLSNMLPRIINLVISFPLPLLHSWRKFLCFSMCVFLNSLDVQNFPRSFSLGHQFVHR